MSGQKPLRTGLKNRLSAVSPTMSTTLQQKIFFDLNQNCVPGPDFQAYVSGMTDNILENCNSDSLKPAISVREQIEMGLSRDKDAGD